MNGWNSPRLGVRFELADDQFRLYGPDEQPFLSASESKREAREQKRRAECAAAELRALGIEPEV